MNYYEILEISQKASQEVIRMAYKALCKKYHPDVYQGDKRYAEQKMKQINEAYETLSDETKKGQYDYTINAQTCRTHNTYQASTQSDAPPKPENNAPTNSEKSAEEVTFKSGIFVESGFSKVKTTLVISAVLVTLVIVIVAIVSSSDNFVKENPYNDFYYTDLEEESTNNSISNGTSTNDDTTSTTPSTPSTTPSAPSTTPSTPSTTPSVPSASDPTVNNSSNTGSPSELSSSASTPIKPSIFGDSNTIKITEGDFRYELAYKSNSQIEVIVDGYVGTSVDVNFPSSVMGYKVNTIGQYIFNDFDSVKSITIPNGVTVIEGCAFWFCDSLISVTLPNSLKEIGNYAFMDCPALTSITIPNGVTYIGTNAFAGCESLTTVTIPDSVTTIRDAPFSGCSNLKTVYFYSELQKSKLAHFFDTSVELKVLA